jgi:hypothetical protein
MDKNRPPESVELVTVGMLPLQSFVSRAIPVPPGTPPTPRPDRPPYIDKTGARPEEEGERNGETDGQ